LYQGIQPEKLAEILLSDMPQWTTEKINAAMHSGKEQYVTLKKQCLSTWYILPLL
jgi:murein L,D-transpeptidase YcbB/YkuD